MVDSISLSHYIEMMKSALIACATILAATTSAIEVGKCPDPASIQSDYVKNNFDVSKFANKSVSLG